MTSWVVLVALSAPGEAAHQAPVITEPAPGAAVQGPTVTVKGTSAGDIVVVRLFEGATVLGDTGPVDGSWSIGVPLSDGAHTIRARGRDGGGVWTALSDPVTFTVDSVAPAAPQIVNPFDGQIVPFSSVTVEGNAEPFARVEVGISTGGDVATTADNGGNWSFTKTFTDAPHTLVARAIDAAGNVSLPSASVTFTVDTLAPAAPFIDTPGDGAFVKPANVRITGRAEPGATVRVFSGGLIGTTTSSSAGTWMIVHTFAEGQHTISARATDAAGHVSPPSASMTFTVDLTAPGIPTIDRPAEGAFVKQHFTVSGSAEPNAKVQVLFNQAVLTDTIASASGAWSVEMSSFSGQKRVQARAVDAAGNIGGLSPVRTFMVDATPPTLEITTRDGTIYLPTQKVRIEGIARDDIGVLAIEVHFFDLLGRQALRKNATCPSCPHEQSSGWWIEHALPPGYYHVKAWAVDRAGNHSVQPAEITYLEL